MKGGKMDTGYYKFYEKKFKIFCLFVLGVVFTTLCFWLYYNGSSAYERLIGGTGGVFFGFCTLAWFLKLFLGKPYIEITPTYIKIDNFEKVLWTDIIKVGIDKRNVSGQEVRIWFIDVKDISKYKLTFMQKINLNAGFHAFCFRLINLSAKDVDKLMSVLEKYVPQNSFDE